MNIRIVSPRVVTLTTAVAGIVIGCSSDAPSGNPTMTGGTGNNGGTGGGSAGSTSVAGSTTSTAGVTSSAAGTVSTSSAGAAGAGGGMGGAAGSGGLAGSGGAGGNAGSTSAGTGGSGPEPVPQVCNVTAPGKGDGQIDYERWLDVTGTGVAQIPVDTPPSTKLVLTELRQGGTALDNFGARMRGYLTPPLSGAYRFWVAGDDNCELWLGTSDMPASKVRVAHFEGEFSGWTNDQQWDKFATQKSADITLEQGKKYYVEVLHKDGVNVDHVSVGWQLPGESGLLPCEIVPGSALSRFGGPDAGEGGAGGAGGAAP